MGVESDERRSWRETRRALFDSVAELYDATRPSYPPEMVEFLVATSSVCADSPVLEVGCGTGQLTRQLVPYRFSLTAIDMAPAMIKGARRHLDDSFVHLDTSSFETFNSDDHTFDLIVSATAFHWIDPAIGWRKVARLLRSTGWLALLETREKYDDPLGAALTQLWVTHSSDGSALTSQHQRTLADAIADTGIFDTATVRSHSERKTLSVDTVFGLEQTRATTLSYDETTRKSFTEGLRKLLDSSSEVHIEQRTSLTMTQVVRGP